MLLLRFTSFTFVKSPFMSAFKYILISCLAFFVSSTIFAQNGTLTLKVKNIEQVKGDILVGLYDNAEDFPDGGKEYRQVKIEVNSKAESYTFEDLPEGEYAIALHHDLNSDGEFQKSFMGMPEEPYGFLRILNPI